MKVRRLSDMRTVLGEGPYWDVKDQQLYFVDIYGKALLRYDRANGDVSSWVTPVQPSCVTRTEDGGFVAALADGFYRFDPGAGTFDQIALVDFGAAGPQLNDGKVDRQGRFVVGGTSNGAPAPLAGVHSFEGKAISLLDTGYTICNGPSWSPDGRTFYMADTMPNMIYAYDYDGETGNVSNKRLFADVTKIGGFADGATVDSRGHLWMAFCGEGKIACFRPDGSVDRIVQTDVKWVSSLAFGGPDLDELYATSFDPAAVANLPADDNSGYLYVIEGLGVTGLAEPLAKIATR